LAADIFFAASCSNQGNDWSLRKKAMGTLNQDTLEKFISENRDKFGDYNPPENHSNRFLFKLNQRIKQLISIVPYLVKVAVVTVVISIASLLVWNNFIRKDRDAISLRDKVSLEFYRLLD